MRKYGLLAGGVMMLPLLALPMMPTDAGPGGSGRQTGVVRSVTDARPAADAAIQPRR